MVRDLMAAGWPAREIAPRIGWKSGELHTLFSRRWLHRDTATAVHGVWAALRNVPGPSELTRRRAAKADLWLPPVDGAAVDVDPVAVQRAVDGDPPATLTRRERREALRVLHARGLTYDEIAQRLHTHTRMVHRDLCALGLVHNRPHNPTGNPPEDHRATTASVYDTRASEGRVSVAVAGIKGDRRSVT
jgi:hypothetical protein